uniref:Uncharacterized protein n=1 Tax=Lepeophtheirus salmonis TaxID=72036 RepID=A0A0K2TXQ5_LEPSM
MDFDLSEKSFFLFDSGYISALQSTRLKFTNCIEQGIDSN